METEKKATVHEKFELRKLKNAKSRMWDHFGFLVVDGPIDELQDLSL